MAWRPNKYLIGGELDNTTPGKVTGWMQFVGMNRKVIFSLKGDFHRDIRGAKIRFRGDATADIAEAQAYMQGFAMRQKGSVGDMTAGLEPADYISGSCYLEWYGSNNGRVVIELEQRQVEVVGTPLPARECQPISRQEQNSNMIAHLNDIARQFSGRA